MTTMTIKQKLLILTAVIVVLVALLSVFFISRLGTISKIHQKVTDITVPLQKVTSAMTVALLDAKLNLNNLVKVDRDLEKFTALKKIIQIKLNEYQILERALLNGNKDLGKEIKGLEGLKVMPSDKGGEIESLTKNASIQFEDFKNICNQIIDKKGEEVELTKSIGGVDKRGGGKTGVVKELDDSLGKLAAAQDDIQFQAMIFDIKRYQDKITRDPNKNDMDELLMVFENLNTIVNGTSKQAAADYFSLYESIANKLMRVVSLKISIDQLNNKDLEDKHELLGQALAALVAKTHEEMIRDSSEAAAVEKNVKSVAIIVCIIGVGICTILGYFFSGIPKKLGSIIYKLTESEEHLSAACVQVASASQSVAQGASEQAASIEETSSSMEEMASMTKMNADHANQADKLMQNALQVMTEVQKSSVDVANSMSKISQASHETSRIVKTIDEIAFQTNLLALNAAVEAARAGEAGAGFAVVANEVRSLAGRAASAAKSTSDLIEGIVKQINEGAETVKKTGSLFKDLVGNVRKGGELVAEISAASKEQSEGINQVNKAVGDMDSVAQQNAASAEESASAAQEMNAQTEMLRDMIIELNDMVGERKIGLTMQDASSLQESGKPIHQLIFPKVQRKFADNKKAILPQESLTDSDIPFDEKETNDF